MTTGERAPQGVSTRIGTLQFTHDFANGYPTRETLETLFDARDFQRACQAYLWALPAASFVAWQQGVSGLGAGNGQIAAFLTYAARKGILTANATTPYYLGFADLSDGPLIMEMPEGVRGGIIDAWQRSLPGTEKAGRYLLVAPGTEPPQDTDGLAVRQSATMNIMIGVRLTATDPVKMDAALAAIKVYPYAQRERPPSTPILDAGTTAWSATPPRGMEYWALVNDVLQREPAQPRDTLFWAMLRPLGFEKGKPFSPDQRQTALLTEGALVGEAMAKANTADRRFADVKYRPDSHWDFALQLDADNPDAFWDLLDERAAWFYEAVSAGPDMAPKRPGPSSAYLGAYRDSTGAWLDGGRSYRLRVPPDPPVGLFWSVTVYDVDTRALILNPQQIADRSSRMPLNTNADGSVDIYCGPTPPPGNEQNWIPTVAGRNWFAYFRLYEPQQAYFDRSWPLPDFEPVP